MPLPNHMLHSTLSQPVTNARGASPPSLVHRAHCPPVNLLSRLAASGDYHPGANNWDIGVSSLFYSAIGIAPSKVGPHSRPEGRRCAGGDACSTNTTLTPTTSQDDYWTTEVQTSPPYQDNCTEPNWQLQAIVVALSTGPNGPSDKVCGRPEPCVRSGDAAFERAPLCRSAARTLRSS